MKKDIHPEFRTVVFHDVGADKMFFIKSTIKTDNSKQIDGIDYPYVLLDVSSASHPFYTGKQKRRASDGRIAKFDKRYARK